MKFHIRWTPAARQQLRAIGQMRALEILKALTPLGEDPYRADVDTTKLTGKNMYRLRCRDYRVVYEIEDHQLVIWVVRVGHRRNVYRKL